MCAAIGMKLKLWSFKMQNSDMDINQVKQIAGSLCGNPEVQVIPIQGGRNSGIFRVEVGGEVFALKFFRPDAQRRRDRFDAETTALELFRDNNVPGVPRIFVKDREKNCLLMEWIEGLSVDHYDEDGIAALLMFVRAVYGISRKPPAGEIRRATEACLSGVEIIRQIHLRLSRLDPAKQAEPILCDFIDKEFMPVFNEVAEWSQEGYKRNRWDFMEDIPFERRTLSLVDIGCHNTLRHGRQFYFVDFEFFGWDDPVKLVADTLQHPGMNLNARQKQDLLEGFLRIYGSDETFIVRLKLLYALFGLKWCMIMLNQFLPGYKPVGVKGVVDNEIQLGRVKNLTWFIRENYQESSYGTMQFSIR